MISNIISKEKFSSDLRVITAIVVEGIGTGKEAEAGFRQAFLERVGLIIMDSDRRLRCLSQNLTLKLEVISSSSSSSQIIRGTTWSNPASGSSVEDGDDESNEEDKDVEGEVLTLWIGQAAGSFLF